MIEDVATRYLDGASLPKLAKEKGLNHSYLCKVLRERCGTEWEMQFSVPDLKFDEKTTLTIPRLLSDKTIKAIHHRLAANRTYGKGKPDPQYLLAGYVICAGCGYSMCVQTNHGGRRYYRHAHAARLRDCPFMNPKPWVPAGLVEEEVLGRIFNMLGNPAALDRAIRDAIPDSDNATKQAKQIEKELKKIDAARNRLLALIVKGTITEAQSEKQLLELNDREAIHRAKMEGLDAILENVLDADALRAYIVELEDSITLIDDEGNTYAGGNDLGSFLLMTDEDKHDLIDRVFGDPLPDGKPAGVYITPAGGDRYGPKGFKYVLKGRVVKGLKGRFYAETKRVASRALPCTARDLR